jgi:hypothetical protein
MVSCIKAIKLPDLSWVRRENNDKFSSKIVMLALVVLLSLISAIPFIQGRPQKRIIAFLRNIFGYPGSARLKSIKSRPNSTKD